MLFLLGYSLTGWSCLFSSRSVDLEYCASFFCRRLVPSLVVGASFFWVLLATAGSGGEGNALLTQSRLSLVLGFCLPEPFSECRLLPPSFLFSRSLGTVCRLLFSFRSFSHEELLIARVSKVCWLTSDLPCASRVLFNAPLEPVCSAAGIVHYVPMAGSLAEASRLLLVLLLLSSFLCLGPLQPVFFAASYMTRHAGSTIIAIAWTLFSPFLSIFFSCRLSLFTPHGPKVVEETHSWSRAGCVSFSSAMRWAQSFRSLLVADLFLVDTVPLPVGTIFSFPFPLLSLLLFPETWKETGNSGLLPAGAGSYAL